MAAEAQLLPPHINLHLRSGDTPEQCPKGKSRAPNFALYKPIFFDLTGLQDVKDKRVPRYILKNQNKRVQFARNDSLCILYQLRCYGKGKLIGFRVSITGLL